MLVLIETAAGYGLFKADKSLKKLDAEDIAAACQKKNRFTLKKFSKFKDTASALSESQAIIEGKMSKSLSKFLSKNIDGEELFVQEKKLANVIKKKIGVEVQLGAKTLEMSRAIREQFVSLVDGLEQKDSNQMSLSLSHGIARYKLQFSAEKVDQMVIQAVALLDDLDRELNTFTMRLKEWYGWQFPEIGRIVTDNRTFVEAVLLIGQRVNVKDIGSELEALLGEEVAAEVRQAAEISMGTEITENDITKIRHVGETILELSNYRSHLADYLKVRMEAVAPNLTYVVGELVAARLIAHAGSLVNLAKSPASTVQILGAEKALFRALKQKKPTPKYGLIYHASLVGRSSPQLKGTISRVLAAKLALSSRVDAFGAKAGDAPTIGIKSKAYLEQRLQELSDQAARGGTKRPIHKYPKYDQDRSGQLSHSNKRQRTQ